MTPESSDQPPRRRRQRYSGKHPRRFDQKYKELKPEAYPGFIEHVRARGDTPAGTHVPILLKEAVEVLHPEPGEMVADCTLGYGGHALEFLKHIGPTGRLVAFDVDAKQIERTRQRILEAMPDANICTQRGNFAGIGNSLATQAIEGYDIIFADLGVSSMQIDDPDRGFTYKHEGPLDMRMDNRIQRTAADLLATVHVQELSTALQELADEPDHQRIAERVIEQRQRRPLKTTSDLVALIMEVKNLAPRRWREQLAAQQSKRSNDAAPKRSKRMLHPAARTFQALRILVNDELGSLRQLLRVAPYCLRPGGRIGIITFHSGEDRLVTEAFEQGVSAGLYAEASPDPIRPSPEEKRDNPRSSPARLRIATRRTESQ